MAEKLGLTDSELSMADNYFSTFLNRPPIMIQGSLNMLNSGHAFSAGNEGLERNKRHITYGLHYLVKHSVEKSLPESSFGSPNRDIDVEIYRSACARDRCLFITNVRTLPRTRDKIFPATNPPTLREWEASMGYVGATESGSKSTSATKESQRREHWSLQFPYLKAVDGSLTTYWQSYESLFTILLKFIGVKMIA